MSAAKQNDPQFKSRMSPTKLRDIELAANALNRSMSAEILARLESSFNNDRKADRKAFAMAAMQGVLANRRDMPWDAVAIVSVSCADALIDELNKEAAE